MKRLLRPAALATILTLALAFSALAAVPAYAKSYQMTRVEIVGEVAPDGSMLVTERRTFDFEGDYTFAYWELDKADSDGLEVIDLAGPEGPYAYTGLSYIDPDRTPQTYSVIDYGSYYDVRAYFRAADTEHTITLRYRVLGAAKRWQDTAELYWKFVGDRWELGASNVSVHIVLPPGVTRDDVKAWAHGPLSGNVVLNDDGTVDLIVDRLPVGTFVEGRVAFPAETLTEATALQEPMLETILAEEDRLAREANTERTTARVLTYGSGGIAFLLPLGALVWAFSYWRTHGKEYKPQFQGQYFREEPANLPPAQVSALLAKWVRSEAESDDARVVSAQIDYPKASTGLLTARPGLFITCR